MIYKLKYATISDIGVFDLIFYNKNREKELINFCEHNGISYLPSQDRKNLYRFTGNGFVPEDLDERLILNPYDRIFEKNTLEKFAKYRPSEVQFIVNDNLIRGVVHIIDYNNKFLQVESL